MKEFKFKTHPADFEILYSAIKNFTLEMGVTMERTSRAPIYFAAHDFSTALFDAEGRLVSLSEYIPIHICAAPFAIRAALKSCGDKIYPGDVILTNDPYTNDAGNHLADWTIMVPVFYNKKLMFWSVNRAHQMDTGGGQMGAYNPVAQDILAEGMRIPPIKIYEKGKPRKDVMDMIMANVRFPQSQKGDLQSMIGSARVGERRLISLVKLWGQDVVQNFVEDLVGYTEYLMKIEVDKIPDGVYKGVSWSDGMPGVGPAVAIRCTTTIKGDSITVDLSESDSMINYYMNSTLANTYSSVFIALMTSIGGHIPYRSEGVMKAVEIKTKPGTLAHATSPAPVGLCTLYVAQQIIESVWDSLAKVIPQKSPAGWGAYAGFTFSGFDPRTGEGYASPDFLANACGAGAIWGTDGWHAGQNPICAGGLAYPEIEICESRYPAKWDKWEITTDSPGAGKWRGGAGFESTFTLESPVMDLCAMGDHFRVMPSPAVDGGQTPPQYNKQLFTRKDGTKEEGGGTFYKLYKDETIACYCQGGCGVGNPLEREVAAVERDVKDEIISVSVASDVYGVIIDPSDGKADEAATARLRQQKSSKK